MHFYTRLIHLISQECWSTITLARTVNERDTLLEEAWEKDEELHHQLEELRVAHTDLIKTEEALKENLQKLRDLIETSPDIIWEIDAKGNFTYISRQVFDLLGYTLMNCSIHQFSNLYRKNPTRWSLPNLHNTCNYLGKFIPLSSLHNIKTAQNESWRFGQTRL